MRQLAGEGRIPVFADFLQCRRFGLRDHADFVAERDQPKVNQKVRTGAHLLFDVDIHAMYGNRGGVKVSVREAAVSSARLVTVW